MKKNVKEEVGFGTAYKAYNKMKKLGQDKRAKDFNDTFSELRNKDDINYDLETGDLRIGGKYAPRRGEEGFYCGGAYDDNPRTDDRRKARAWADAANKYRKHFSPDYSGREYDKNDFIAESDSNYNTDRQKITLNEAQFKKLISSMVNESVSKILKEYKNWKTQMLDATKDGDIDIDGVRKANKMANRKYGENIKSNNGKSYRNFVNVDPESGFLGSEETYEDKPKEFKMHGTIIKPNSKKEGGVETYSDTLSSSEGFVGKDKYPISSPEVSDLQGKAKNDIEDYYSGNYKKRLQDKAKSLPNAKSGQDFTPRALKESRKKKINEGAENINISQVVADFMNEVKKAGNLSELVEDNELVQLQGKLYKYNIWINITERPYWHMTSHAVYYPVDCAREAEYRLEGDLSFDIDMISVEDEDDVIYEGLLNDLNREQVMFVYNAFDFDEEEWADYED